MLSNSHLLVWPSGSFSNSIAGLSLPVVPNPLLGEDTAPLYAHDPAIGAVLYVGTAPIPDHWREARLIVRRGLADVLDQLGWDVECVTVADGLLGVKRGAR